MSFALRRPSSPARNRLRLVDYQPAKWVPSVLLVLGLAHFSAAQVDPIKNFCRRFGHQTAIIDRKLYIDGGFVNYNPISQNSKNYSSMYRVLPSVNPIIGFRVQQLSTGRSRLAIP